MGSFGNHAVMLASDADKKVCKSGSGTEPKVEKSAYFGECISEVYEMVSINLVK